MNFKNYLEKSAKEINQELDIFFKDWDKEVESASLKLVSLNKNFIEACKGGKRLRGTLVKLGYEIAKWTIDNGQLTKEEGKEILKPAAAFEIFQTAILAHDDIVDLSPLRRGKPTLYRELGGNHYGISQTICLGDIGFFLAYKLLSESNFPDQEKNEAMTSFTDSMLKTALGEVLDIEIPHLNKTKEETDALTIFKLKTAYYTLIGPLTLGAILGKGRKKLLDDIKRFGMSLGIAFQIQDDILGVFGDEETLGKSVTSDIEEGKITLLYLYALANISVEQSQILEKYYGKGKIGESELGKIRKVFTDTGALTYSRQKAANLVSESKKIIPQLTKNPEQRAILEEMADFLVKREK